MKDLRLATLKQLADHVKADTVISWEWDRKVDGQYRIEIIVPTPEKIPLDALVRKNLGDIAHKINRRSSMNKEKVTTALALLHSMVLGKEDHTEGSMRIYKDAMYEVQSNCEEGDSKADEQPPLKNS